MSEFDYIPSNIVAAEFEATPHFTEGNEEPTIFYECVALLTRVAREWTEHELSIPQNRQIALYKHIRPAKGYIHQAGHHEVTGPSLDEIAAKGSFWQVGLSGDRIHARYHREQGFPARRHHCWMATHPARHGAEVVARPRSFAGGTCSCWLVARPAGLAQLLPVPLRIPVHPSCSRHALRLGALGTGLHR